VCEICGDTATPRRVEGVYDHFTGDRFALLQCRSCGYATTEPVPASLDRYYPERYRRFNRVAARILRSLYLARVDAWLRRLPATGVALEIGSGTGWMLGALRARGWRAIGSERELGAAKIARSASGAPIFVGDLGAIRPAAGLDLVVMFHVLEHLANPGEALRAAAARLRPGGTLVLGLPNIASWQSRFAGRRWMHLDVPRHLCHFTPMAIERALIDAGFRLVQIRFVSLEHDPLGWVQGALEKLGFEDGIVLKILFGMRGRRSGVGRTLAALILAVPLGAVGFPIALASWRAGAGALMEVWAEREPSRSDL
jgi:SAM-dependent methyltransferase